LANGADKRAKGLIADPNSSIMQSTRYTMKISLPIIGLASLLVFCPPSASAQKKKPKPPNSQNVAPEDNLTKAKELFERGEAFYKLGEYDKALNEYREAYLVSKAPLLLLNIAQCYRYLGQYEEAKHNYEAFVREDPNSLYRQEMEDKIAEMEIILDAKRRDADKTPASLVVTVKGPAEENRRVKPWIKGAGIGAMVLGGSALTFLLLRDNLPEANGGNVAIEF
jgi:tetratricopeptide (TPR) repeat protein